MHKSYCDIVTIHKNVTKKHKEESKAFLKEYAVNKDNASMLIKRLRKITRKASDNIKKVIDEPKKGLEDIKEVLHTHMKNRKDLYDNTKVLYESKKACRKTLYDIKTACTKRLQDIEKIFMYTDIEKTFDDIQKELELIKNESYYIKKNIKSNKKEIGKIKNNALIEKVFFVKNEKLNIKGNIRNEINELASNTHDIRKMLQVVNKCLVIFKGREHANRELSNKTCVIIHSNKKRVHNASEDYNFIVDRCNTIIKKIHSNKKIHSHKKIQGNKKELHKPLVKINNVNKIDINHEKITMLRKNYVLLGRDMELVLRKFIYERFLSRQFRGKATCDGKVMLVS